MPSTQYDKNWKIIGHVSDDGKTLYDADWQVIGHVSDDGKTIHDEHWQTSGHLSDDGKTLFDQNWNAVGHVSDDGKTIYDAHWNVAQRSRQPHRTTFVRSSAPSHRSGSREGAWVGWLLGALLVLAILYFIFVVVVPFVILNVALLALIGAFLVQKKRKMLLWSSAAGMLYLFFDMKVNWLAHHLLRDVNVGQSAINFIFYLNTLAGMIAVFLLSREWIEKNTSATPAPAGNASTTTISQSLKRQLYVVCALVVIATGVIYLFKTSAASGYNPADAMYAEIFRKPEPPSAPSGRSYALNGRFREASLGDLYHLIFVDGNGREWDFGDAGTKNNLGAYTLDLGGGQTNPSFRGKQFLITYDSIVTKAFAGEDDTTGYLTSVPRIVQLELRP